MTVEGLTRRMGMAALAAAMLGGCAVASAAPALSSSAGFDGHVPQGYGLSNAVFVETDGLGGNQIVTYSRNADGTLTQTGVYNTGGLGGQLTGSVVDHTASQGALDYDPSDRLLLAVNAGSNTVSVFEVFGDRLALRQVIGSGGAFPVSVTAKRGEAFVLNAEQGGSVQGYAVAFGRLWPVPWLHRSLRIATGDPGEAEQFTHTPGEVAFSPDGSQLLVTTKAGGQSIDVFNSYAWGGLSRNPVVNADDTVPFAVAFDPQGQLLVAEAAGALASFRLDLDGTLGELDSVPTEQVATCWLTPAAGYYYTSNAGSATVSGFQVAPDGQLTLLGNTGTDPGPVDGASVGDYLYLQGGQEGTVDEFRVAAGGGLESLGSVLVPGGAGGEGIVAG